MTWDEFFELGVTKTLGAHRFEAEEIKRFAATYDPQPFHMDEKAAEQSVLGGLCASGWHTASMWMRQNLLSLRDAKPWQGDGPAPAFGPSPGFENLQWLKPVYAGDTITYTRSNLSHRAMASRPGWRILSMRAEGVNQHGDMVIAFDSAVLVKTG